MCVEHTPLTIDVWSQDSKHSINVWGLGSKHSINVWGQGSKHSINVWGQGSKKFVYSETLLKTYLNSLKVY